MTHTVVAPGKDAELIGLDLAELAAGEALEGRCDAETVAVVLGGIVDVTVDGVPLGRTGARRSVFEGPGHAVYAPPGTRLRLVTEGPRRVRHRQRAARRPHAGVHAHHYHPVVAAPGYALYYLWIMAGDGRQMIPHLDPAHAWVAEA